MACIAACTTTVNTQVPHGILEAHSGKTLNDGCGGIVVGGMGLCKAILCSIAAVLPSAGSWERALFFLFFPPPPIATLPRSHGRILYGFDVGAGGVKRAVFRFHVLIVDY